MVRCGYPRVYHEFVRELLICSMLTEGGSVQVEIMSSRYCQSHASGRGSRQVASGSDLRDLDAASRACCVRRWVAAPGMHALSWTPGLSPSDRME